MANLFLSGSTSSMDWAKSSNVRFVEGLLTGAEEPTRSTSKNGDTLTV